jgi:parvulin-like peptidyl-prolyl isomerase
MNKWIVAGLLALGMAGFFPSSGKAETVDEITLVVDQESMTRGELEESIDAYFAVRSQKPAAPGSAAYLEAKKQVEDNFIQEVVLAEEADREKIEVSDSDVEGQVNQEIEGMKRNFSTDEEFQEGLHKEGITLEDLKQDTRDRMLRRIKAGRVLHTKQEALPSTAVVTDQQVRDYYQKHPQDYEQAKFSIILFGAGAKASAAKRAQAEKQAQSVLAELKNGADFAAEAKKYSEDSGTRDNGGEVGTVYRSDMDPELAKGIFAMKAKSLGIVTGAEGYYVVQLEFKGTADYAAVASGIKDHLQKTGQSDAMEQWIDQLKAKAYIMEDGKVVVYKAKPLEPVTASSTSPSSNTSSNLSTAQNAPATVASEPATEEDSDLPPVVEYPTLPDADSWTLTAKFNGINYNTQDLGDFYGFSVNSNQNFPFGFGLNFAADLALDPTFQAGVEAEFLRKTVETINHSGETDLWNSAVLGPALHAKLLIPLDEGTNFDLSLSGGYYFLVGAGVTVSGPVTENMEASCSSFGGVASADFEFFTDSSKNTSIDFGLAYRYLKFTNLSTNVTTANPLNYASPLQNANGGNASIDYSGIEVGLGLRFYLGKGD